MGTDKKINVCHLASGDLWAGAEVQMFTLLKTLSDEPSLRLSAIILNPGKLAEQLKNIDIEVEILDERKDGLFALRRKIIESLREKKIDILHSHRYKENILASLIKNKCGIKYLVQTVHGVGEPGGGFALIKARTYGLVNRLFTRQNFDKVIAVSDDIRQRINKIIPDPRLLTIHNALDPKAIKPSKPKKEIRQEFNIDIEAPVIGAAGRMVPVKAYDLFLQMAKKILVRRPDARFMLVGDGPLKQSLQDLSEKFGIESEVILPGFRDDIIDIINAFDIFVISSHHEGIPMALLEAMSLRKAVVSTAVGGIVEVIQNDVSGLLVEPESAGALADACLRVIEDAVLKKNIGEAAGLRIHEEFSIEILQKRVVSLYKTLVDSI